MRRHRFKTKIPINSRSPLNLIQIRLRELRSRPVSTILARRRQMEEHLSLKRAQMSRGRWLGNLNWMVPKNRTGILISLQKRLTAFERWLKFTTQRCRTIYMRRMNPNKREESMIRTTPWPSQLILKLTTSKNASSNKWLRRNRSCRSLWSLSNKSNNLPLLTLSNSALLMLLTSELSRIPRPFRAWTKLSKTSLRPIFASWRGSIIWSRKWARRLSRTSFLKSKKLSRWTCRQKPS